MFELFIYYFRVYKYTIYSANIKETNKNQIYVYIYIIHAQENDNF